MTRGRRRSNARNWVKDYLGAHAPVPLRDLRDALGLQPDAASKLMRRMEGAGEVVRADVVRLQGCDKPVVRYALPRLADASESLQSLLCRGFSSNPTKE